MFKNVTAPVDEGITDVMKRDSDVDKIEVVQVISDFNKGRIIVLLNILMGQFTINGSFPHFLCVKIENSNLNRNYWRKKKR